MDFLSLKKNLKKDLSHLQKIKLAILGDTSTQLLGQAIKGYGIEEHINLDIYEAGYNQIEHQILDPASELYQFAPDFVLIFQATQKHLKNFYQLDEPTKQKYWQTQIEKVTHLYHTVQKHHTCQILYLNAAEIDDSVYGNYANKTNVSFLYQLRNLNCELMQLGQTLPNFHICDLCALQSHYGHTFVFDPKTYTNMEMVFSLDFLPVVAKHTVDIIKSVSGKINKCLILDLDNTLWGGIIGDDGLENIQLGDLGIGKVFVELQQWILQLKKRGIILAVCSKNEEEIAKEPFDKHPNMVLQLTDIAVFVANWHNKADNIKHIQSILNIGFDSMVFIDDNPYERNIVHMQLPEVSVPDLPKDPAEYLPYLKTLNLFETTSLTKDDANRTEQYQTEAIRKTAQLEFENETEFLCHLDMTSQIRPFDTFHIPRIAQLTQRSNQFNLRTIRYSEQDIQDLSNSDQHIARYFTLKDKFGDYGLVSVVILEKKQNALFIDTWLMSCRVLKRSLEQFIMNWLMKYATDMGYKSLTAEYIPTAKNGIVKDLYPNLGFTHTQNGYLLDIQNTHLFETQIRETSDA